MPSGPRRPPPAGTSVSGSAHSACFARAPVGGITSCSARANVETYSRAIHAGEVDEVGRHALGEHAPRPDELLRRHVAVPRDVRRRPP